MIEIDTAGLKRDADRLGEYEHQLKALAEQMPQGEYEDRLISIIHRINAYREALMQVAEIYSIAEEQVFDRLESGKRSYKSPGVGKIKAAFAGEDIRKCM